MSNRDKMSTASANYPVASSNPALAYAAVADRAAKDAYGKVKESADRHGIWFFIITIIAFTLFWMVILWVFSPKIVLDPNGHVSIWKNLGISFVVSLLLVFIAWIFGKIMGRPY